MAVDVFLQTLNNMEQRAIEKDKQAYGLAQTALAREAQRVDTLQKEKFYRVQQLDDLNNKLAELGVSGIENPVVKNTIKSNIVSDATDIKTDVSSLNNAIDSARGRMSNLIRISQSAQQRFRDFATSPDEKTIVAKSDLNEGERENLITALGQDFGGTSREDIIAGIQLARNAEQPVYYSQLTDQEKLDLMASETAAKNAAMRAQTRASVSAEQLNLLNQRRNMIELGGAIKNQATEDILRGWSPSQAAIWDTSDVENLQQFQYFQELEKQGFPVKSLRRGLISLANELQPAYDPEKEAYLPPSESQNIRAAGVIQDMSEEIYNYALRRGLDLSSPEVAEMYDKLSNLTGVSSLDLQQAGKAEELYTEAVYGNLAQNLSDWTGSKTGVVPFVNRLSVGRTLGGLLDTDNAVKEEGGKEGGKEGAQTETNLDDMVYGIIGNTETLNKLQSGFDKLQSEQGNLNKLSLLMSDVNRAKEAYNKASKKEKEVWDNINQASDAEKYSLIRRYIDASDENLANITNLIRKERRKLSPNEEAIEGLNKVINDLRTRRSLANTLLISHTTKEKPLIRTGSFIR